jgi:single-strand DNA-binding protein
MNSVNLTGRFTRDPEVRYADSGTSIARFSLAVDRRFKQEGGPQADFPNCVAFGKTAEFIEKYFSKGMKIELCGRIQTGSYTKEDGTKVYTTDVVAESVGFAESKAVSQGNSGEQSQGGGFGPADANGFVNIPDGIADEELPF